MTISVDDLMEKLRCPCCNKVCVDQRLVAGIRNIFGMLGRELPINSGCRCEKHNLEVGGAPHSEHLMAPDHPQCRAVDLGVSDPDEQEDISAYARKLGFGGIGWGKSFLHIDLGADREWRYGPDGKPIYKGAL